jgi:hypothetical protein
MELTLGGLIGAMVGAALGALNFAIIAPMVNEKLRATDTQGRADIEERITLARRGILAFNMLVFVCAGYWAGTALG